MVLMVKELKCIHKDFSNVKRKTDRILFFFLFFRPFSINNFLIIINWKLICKLLITFPIVVYRRE